MFDFDVPEDRASYQGSDVVVDDAAQCDESAGEPRGIIMTSVEI